MSFGDCLKRKLENGDFLDCENVKNSPNAFWVKLRDTAVQDIIECCPQKIDSDIAIKLYYSILSENMNYLPDFICAVLPSNKQERFRVVNRNLFSSNAFKPKGLANQKGVYAYKSNSTTNKGEKIVFQCKGEKK